MATKKDLVEAYSFSRRRLVTAFVSGAPGGREVEPSRPGRTIVGGVALAVLLIAGAAVLGILKPPVTFDINEDALVSDKESGADYVAVDAPDGGRELRPVANITSAMLLLGPGLEPESVPPEELAKYDRGEAIGILGAPATPPESGGLLATGWTACTADGAGVRVGIAESPDVVPAPAVGLVVRAADDGTTYLIAETTLPGLPTRAYSYELPTGDDADLTLQNVFAATASPVIEVPRSFLTLFPAGGALDLRAFGLTPDAVGKRSDLAGQGSVPGRARVGQVLDDDGVRYLLTRTGAIKLTAFADAVWRSLSVRGAKKPEDLRVSQGPTVPTPPDLAELGVSTWPATTLQQNTSSDVCGLLATTEGAQPAVRLATTSSTSAAAAGDTPPAGIARFVESGHGALVTIGDWDASDTGALLLIDDRGYAYPVGGEAAKTNLGYDGVDAVVVPDSWTSLFSPGVTLSVDAARCPPTAEPQQSGCLPGG